MIDHTVHVPRRSVIDTDRFASVVAEALRAFQTDSAYATSMARTASAILAKRRVWAVRTEVRQAERDARQQCVDHQIQVCGSRSPCGTGDCAFATGSLATPAGPVLPGQTTRPVPSLWGGYTLEPLVEDLLDSDLPGSPVG